MKRFLAILGTRPEAIKMAPLIRELREREGAEVILLHTGQHRELTDRTLKAFGLTPDRRLPHVDASDLSSLTASLLQGITPVLREERPSMALIHGDTAGTLAAAVACFYAGVPAAHVEAGLRSGDLYAPFPEEWNRRVVSLTASLQFAPTERAKRNLLKEGIDLNRIFVVGNTGIDALRYTVTPDFCHPLLPKEKRRLILFTAHRRESWGAPLVEMACALRQVLAARTDLQGIVALSPNPALRQAVMEVLADEERVTLTEPLSPEIFHNLLARCALVMTDSGGIQEEAVFLGKPTLVMRQKTERQEGLNGSLILVGQRREEIVREALSLLSDGERYARLAKPSHVFGDGFASRRIADTLLAHA